jgi:hypothetical protein
MCLHGIVPGEATFRIFSRQYGGKTPLAPGESAVLCQVWFEASASPVGYASAQQNTIVAKILCQSMTYRATHYFTNASGENIPAS